MGRRGGNGLVGFLILLVFASAMLGKIDFNIDMTNTLNWVRNQVNEQTGADKRSDGVIAATQKMPERTTVTNEASEDAPDETKTLVPTQAQEPETQATSDVVALAEAQARTAEAELELERLRQEEANAEKARLQHEEAVNAEKARIEEQKQLKDEILSIPRFFEQKVREKICVPIGVQNHVWIFNPKYSGYLTQYSGLVLSGTIKATDISVEFVEDKCVIIAKASSNAPKRDISSQELETDSWAEKVVLGGLKNFDKICVPENVQRDLDENLQIQTVTAVEARFVQTLLRQNLQQYGYKITINEVELEKFRGALGIDVLPIMSEGDFLQAGLEQKFLYYMGENTLPDGGSVKYSKTPF